MTKFSSFHMPMALAAAALVFLPGCVMDQQSDLPSYPTSSRGQAMQVFEVQVLSVQRVKLRGESSVVGVGAGALAGGIAGSMIGSGKASTLAAVGGALAGGLAGDAIERRATSGVGVEITVQTRSGQTWSVVQNDRGENFQVGEWVRMLVGPDRRTIAR